MRDEPASDAIEHSLVRTRRSVLFVPGSRPDRFTKAIWSGADSVCLDLEDGVAAKDRDRARDEVARFLAATTPRDRRSSCGSTTRARRRAGSTSRRWPRVRCPTRSWCPRGESAALLEEVHGGLTGDAAGSGVVLFPLVETALGFHRLEEIATAAPVAALVFGGMDLSTQTGGAFSWEPLLYARSRLVLAAALAGIVALDVPFAGIRDPAGLLEEARRSARLGFAGKLAIHPAQVGPIHDAFTPTIDELERARGIIEADAQAGGGAFLLDGAMVDRPLVLAARRTLALARRDTPSDGAEEPGAKE